MDVRVTRWQLAPEVGSIARARDLLRGAAAGLPARTLDDAELLVSELVTNAVQHGGASIRLELRVGGSAVGVRVYDSSGRLPTMGAAQVAPDVPSGRGLRLVDRLAASWGVDAEGDGKVVWFEIAAAQREPVVAAASAAESPDEPLNTLGDAANDVADETSAKDHTAWS